MALVICHALWLFLAIGKTVVATSDSGLEEALCVLHRGDHDHAHVQIDAHADHTDQGAESGQPMLALDDRSEDAQMNVMTAFPPLFMFADVDERSVQALDSQADVHITCWAKIGQGPDEGTTSPVRMCVGLANTFHNCSFYRSGAGHVHALNIPSLKGAGSFRLSEFTRKGFAVVSMAGADTMLIKSVWCDMAVKDIDSSPVLELARWVVEPGWLSELEPGIMFSMNQVNATKLARDIAHMDK